jgi:hypothetical protein
MIPHIVTDTSITFFARNQPWFLAQDHPSFGEVKNLLLEGTDDGEALVRKTDVRELVDGLTEGRACLSENGIVFDGLELDETWSAQVQANPGIVKVLVVKEGDRVRIEDDEDAEDGIYIVGAVDAGDSLMRIFVEDEAKVGFFGYVSNASIKEILR